MPRQRRGRTQSLGKHSRAQGHRRNQICHRHTGRLRLDERTNRQAQAGFHLSAVDFMGPPACARTAGQVIEKSSAGPDGNFATATRRKNNYRRFASAVSSSNAQDYLGAGATRSLVSKTENILAQLRAYESRNVTFIERDGSWPIVWERAKGVHVWDAEGGKYLDLTAAFGVAAAGHANPRVVRAGQTQMAKLLHAMGDVHPHALKAQLARVLSRITFERWKPGRRGTPPYGITIFCNSGFEAVEAALKTSMLATGKREIIAFTGAYHGLGYGALNATHRKHFREPFRSQL